LNPSKKPLYHFFQHFLYQNCDVASIAYAHGDRHIPLILHLDAVMGQMYLFVYIGENLMEIKELFFSLNAVLAKGNKARH
jgi:uncharacterized integral membrane protein